MELRDSVVIVTGGASGLGEACVRELSKRKAKVSILDFSEEKGQLLASELGDEVIFCHTDVTDEKAVQTAVDKTMKVFGGIQVAINCAGVGIPCKVLSKEGPMPMDHFAKVLKINLVGTMNVIRLTAEKMVANEPNDDGEKGVVINTASVAAFDGQIGQAAYSASKAGVAGMTLPIAREFAEYGIRNMTIAPGIFETPMMQGLSEKALESLIKSTTFPKRLGKPFEFAALAIHIIINPMLNGEVIRLDGSIRMAAR